MTRAPAIPMTPESPTKMLQRLRIVIMRMHGQASDCTSRQQFINLLDYLLVGNSKDPLPTHRTKSLHRTRLAIIYAALVYAVRLVADNEDLDAMESAVTFVEWASTAEGYTIIGSETTGFTMQPSQAPAPAPTETKKT